MTVDIGPFRVFQVLLFFIFVFFPIKVYGAAVKRLWRSKFVKTIIESPLKPEFTQDGIQVGDIRLYKDLFFKLQNLERYPEVLPQSRELLIALLTKALAEARDALEPGILSLEQYTPEGLVKFLQSENDKTTRQWEQYLGRRAAGSQAELFGDREEAKWWLRQIAPVKYVDGAWLGHINKITTPFALRHVTKDAWQVMSEELGDGDPQKNHVYVYRELMQQIEPGFPDADNADFIHPRHQLDEKCVWEAAVAQLLISLFPHEFLPEILGFNMHFEGLTMETMTAAKEVEEFGLDAYYFLLHISIDNADSGHTAIAMQAVVKYIEHVRQTQGDAAAQLTWRRVQGGFLLSKGLSAMPTSPSRRTAAVESFPRNIREAEVIKILKAKAPVAHKIHCSSRMWIGGRKLDDWFEPHAFAGKQWQMDFLYSLSNLRPWVRKGNSSKSRLIQELQWGGKMFGAFTQSEVETLKRWIDTLGNPSPQLYLSFAGRSEIKSDQVHQKQDIRTDYPVLSPISTADLQATSPLTEVSPLPLLHLSLIIKSLATPDMCKLLPLWFANQCLLESFVCIPSKTTTVTASSIVRLLRAQYGFDAEGPGVAGMDEARRLDSAGLVEIGLELTKASGLPEPSSLKEVLDMWPSDFALKMLHWSMRPMVNHGLLMGLAKAFVGLHDAMASSMLLSVASRAALMQIVSRERECLDIGFKELEDDKVGREDFQKGYAYGRAEIDSCYA